MNLEEKIQARLGVVPFFLPVRPVGAGPAAPSVSMAE